LTAANNPASTAGQTLGQRLSLTDDEKVFANRCRRLDLRDVLSLGSFLTLDYLKLDFLVFGQGPETVTLDGAVMHEDIRPVVPGDKTESFGVIEPFNLASFPH
jgi:hypothetical protein